MSDNKKHNNQGPLIFVGIAIGIVAILLGVLVYQNHESSPEVQSQKASISSSKKDSSEQSSISSELEKKTKEFKNAPKGNYIILGNGIYKTSWTKQQLEEFLTKTAEDIKQNDLNAKFNTDFGTKYYSLSSDNSNADSVIIGMSEDDINNIYFDSAYAAFKKNPSIGMTLENKPVTR
ncbi:hypothetical protein K1728_05605 [Weissella confusa]|uniref:hypothetical protein n=1 Tax=Weissella confusa TaxID=1583 RepID=UPI001C6F9907|nr:hypothetical protein [Weissella confusa]QYU58874.1 hypothetical protein K1728_05605 [Weissella confusa]